MQWLLDRHFCCYFVFPIEFVVDIRCPAIPVEDNRYADSSDNYYSVVVTLYCHTGFSFFSDVEVAVITVTCMSDARWDVEIPSCLGKSYISWAHNIIVDAYSCTQLLTKIISFVLQIQGAQELIQTEFF